jgi:hypothetical protein
MKKGEQAQILLVSSGDLRLSANQNCWAAPTSNGREFDCRNCEIWLHH